MVARLSLNSCLELDMLLPLEGEVSLFCSSHLATVLPVLEFRPSAHRVQLEVPCDGAR